MIENVNYIQSPYKYNTFIKTYNMYIEIQTVPNISPR